APLLLFDCCPLFYLPLFSRLIQLPIPLGEELLLPAVEDRGAGVRACHTPPRSAPASADALSGWRLSLPACSCFRCFFMRSLHYPNGGTFSPFPAEPEQISACEVAIPTHKRVSEVARAHAQ